MNFANSCIVNDESSFQSALQIKHKMRNESFDSLKNGRVFGSDTHCLNACRNISLLFFTFPNSLAFCINFCSLSPSSFTSLTWKSFPNCCIADADDTLLSFDFSGNEMVNTIRMNTEYNNNGTAVAAEHCGIDLINFVNLLMGICILLLSACALCTL